MNYLFLDAKYFFHFLEHISVKILSAAVRDIFSIMSPCVFISSPERLQNGSTRSIRYVIYCMARGGEDEARRDETRRG